MAKPRRKKNLSEQEKKTTKFFLVIFVLILSFVAFSFSLGKLFYSSVLEKREVDASIIVSDRVGFDLNTEILAFGKVTKGGSSTRKLKIENNYPFPVCIEIIPSGEIKIFIDREKFCLNVGEKSVKEITAYVPIEIPYRDYEGKIVFITRKV